MKFSRKIIGCLIAITTVAAHALPVFAAPETTSATSNILDNYSETVVVPSALKVALNPHGYKVTIGYKLTSDTIRVNNKHYYIKNASGEYERKVFTDLNEGWDDLKGSLYEGITSTNQIVSLNYGVLNKSTKAVDLKVDFNVTTNGAGSGKPIVFVADADSATKITQGGDGTAKTNEPKMYLAVKTANAAPTANTYVNTKTWTDNTEVFYKWDTTTSAYVLASNDGKFGGAADFNAAKAAATGNKLYKSTTTIGADTLASELADVTVGSGNWAADTTYDVFAKGANDANASVSYKLDKPTWSLKDEEDITFETTQDELGASKFEITAIDGYTAFTLDGVMNDDCDWTKVNTKAITIAPVYEIIDSNGSETGIDGTRKKVTLNIAPSVTTTNFAILEAGKDATINVSLGTGSLKATGVSKVTWKSSDGTETANLLGNNCSYEDGVITIGAVHVDFLRAHAGDTLEIEFNDTATTKVVITLTAKP